MVTLLILFSVFLFSAILMFYILVSCIATCKSCGGKLKKSGKYFYCEKCGTTYSKETIIEGDQS
jgi:tRNA(Ile2) C34 agmatinyltransferase TiaS